MEGQASRACRASLGSHIEVELIYKESFQFLAETRNQIRSVMERFGLCPDWQEWVLEDTMIPKYVARYPSATILVNEKDICPEIRFAKGSSNRIYVSSLGSVSEIPSKVYFGQGIREALDSALFSNAAIEVYSSLKHREIL